MMYFNKGKNSNAVVETDEQEMQRRKFSFGLHELDISVGLLDGDI